MTSYQLSKEWVEKNSERIKEAYSSAMARGYDISSEADILELLKVIDPSNATEENAKALSGILQLFSRAIKRKFEPKKEAKEKVLN